MFISLNIFLQCNSVYLTEEEFEYIFNIIGKESKSKITNQDIENLLFFNPTKHYFPKSPKSDPISLNSVINSEPKINSNSNLNYTFQSNTSINLLLDYDPKYEYQLLNYLSFIMDKESQIEQCRNQLVLPVAVPPVLFYYHRHPSTKHNSLPAIAQPLHLNEIYF